jgi:hypothetical protein
MLKSIAGRRFTAHEDMHTEQVDCLVMISSRIAGYCDILWGKACTNLLRVRVMQN